MCGPTRLSRTSQCQRRRHGSIRPALASLPSITFLLSRTNLTSALTLSLNKGDFNHVCDLVFPGNPRARAVARNHTPRNQRSRGACCACQERRESQLGMRGASGLPYPSRHASNQSIAASIVAFALRARAVKGPANNTKNLRDPIARHLTFCFPFLLPFSLPMPLCASVPATWGALFMAGRWRTCA